MNASLIIPQKWHLQMAEEIRRRMKEHYDDQDEELIEESIEDQ